MTARPRRARRGTVRAPWNGTGSLDSAAMSPLPDADERTLVEGIAARSDELVALLCDLIRFDTTSRSAPGRPRTRGGRAAALPRRPARGRGRGGRRVGARRGRGRGPPALPRGRDRLRGPAAARRALQGRRRRALAALQRAHRRRARAPRGRLGRRPVRPAGGRRARDRPRRVRHEGRDRGDGRGRGGARGGRRPRGGPGRVHEHRRGVQRDRRPGLRPARRRGRLRDRDGAELARGLARLSRLRLLLRRGRGPRRAHGAGARRASATAARSTRSRRRGTCWPASTRCVRSGAAGWAPATRCSTRPTSS